MAAKFFILAFIVLLAALGLNGQTTYISTGDITTQDGSTTGLTTSPMSTGSITSALTTSPMSTGSITSALTTSPMSTGSITSALTTSPMSTGSVTSSPMSTGSVTSALTTNSVTSASMTTSPMSTGEVTSSPITSASMTTSPMSTGEITSGMDMSTTGMTMMSTTSQATANVTYTVTATNITTTTGTVNETLSSDLGCAANANITDCHTASCYPVDGTFDGSASLPTDNLPSSDDGSSTDVNVTVSFGFSNGDVWNFTAQVTDNFKRATYSVYLGDTNGKDAGTLTSVSGKVPFNTGGSQSIQVLISGNALYPLQLGSVSLEADIPVLALTSNSKYTTGGYRPSNSSTTHSVPTPIAMNASSSGLTTGAKIAIGICVPVGVIIIIFIIAFIVMRKKGDSDVERGGNNAVEMTKRNTPTTTTTTQQKKTTPTKKESSGSESSESESESDSASTSTSETSSKASSKKSKSGSESSSSGSESDSSSGSSK